MKRLIFKHIREWYHSPKRKPLILRGARQVGKTWLVRHLAQQENITLIELNLEKRPSLISLFQSNEPKQILLNLEASLNTKINSNNSLLFIDEIQAAPELLAKLRWFAEDMPELPVISAGSLLEFVLTEHSFSMPVGRISYMHLEPMSFEEFLLAKDKQVLFEYLTQYNLSSKIPEDIHLQLITLFKEYIIIGGMPDAVLSWIMDGSLVNVNQVHHDLIATYQDDFAKYNSHFKVEDLNTVMLAIPKMLGQKFIYSRIDPNLSVYTVKKIITLLNKARVTHRVTSTAANGIPLGAEAREKYFKEIFLDCGLASTALGLSFNQINAANEVNLINNSGIAEQIVGQLLRTINPYFVEPTLFYWLREEAGSNAEIDYVIQHDNQVIPIEVKAGSTGSLRSLHLFMDLKSFKLAVRINSDLPNKTDVNVKNHIGKNIGYTLLSLPFYLIGQLHRLISNT